MGNNLIRLGQASKAFFIALAASKWKKIFPMPLLHFYD